MSPVEVSDPVTTRSALIIEGINPDGIACFGAVGCTARAAGADAEPFVFVNMDFSSMKLPGEGNTIVSEGSDLGGIATIKVLESKRRDDRD
jgi:hypothetical protein